jgi:hypothetical protein
MASLWARILDHQNAKQRTELENNLDGIHGVIWQMAAEGAGLKVSEPFEVDHAAEIIEAESEMVDVKRHVELATKRIAWSKTAANIEQLRVDAEAADREIDELNRLARESAQLARDKKESAILKSMAYQAAIKAQSDLIASALVLPEEQQLSARQTELGREIDRHNTSLNARTADSFLNHANRTRAELAAAPKAAPKRDQLEKNVAHWEGRIAEAKQRLATLQKERDAIHAKLAKLQAAKLKPENFAIMRRRVARDMVSA